LLGGGFFSRDSRMRDALHTISALLHHTAAADGYIRIAQHLQLWRVPILEQQEVEPTHLVGTVVRAVARPYAAVVNHVVQAFGAMRGGTDWADHFARCVFALHARHRLEICLGIIAITLVISVHTQPVHVATLIDLL